MAKEQSFPPTEEELVEVLEIAGKTIKQASKHFQKRPRDFQKNELKEIFEFNEAVHRLFVGIIALSQNKSLVFDYGREKSKLLEIQREIATTVDPSPKEMVQHDLKLISAAAMERLAFEEAIFKGFATGNPDPWKRLREKGQHLHNLPKHLKPLAPYFRKWNEAIESRDPNIIKKIIPSKHALGKLKKSIILSRNAFSNISKVTLEAYPVSPNGKGIGNGHPRNAGRTPDNG